MRLDDATALLSTPSRSGFLSSCPKLFAALVVAVAVVGSPLGHAGDLLVSSESTNSVLRYEGTTGAFVGVFASGLSGPEGLAFGPDGNLYVASFFSSDVKRFDGKTGAFIDTFVPAGSGGLSGAVGVLFGPDGNFYVGSRSTTGTASPFAAILRYDGTSGAFIDVFAFGGGLSGPDAFVFGPDGNLYVSSRFNDRVLRYDGATGAFVGEFVSAGGGGLATPEGLAFGPDGNLYVASRGTSSVLRYAAVTGALLGAFVPSGSGGLSGPFGLAFGPDQNLYVTSVGTNSVLRYDGTTGAFLGTFASGGGLTTPTVLFFQDASDPRAALLDLAGFLEPTSGKIDPDPNAGDMTGPNLQANFGRLRALKNRVQSALDLFDMGDPAGALSELFSALRKTDGLVPPPDWVRGAAAMDLFDQITAIVDLINAFDSDGDGVANGDEIAAGTDPNDPTDF